MPSIGHIIPVRRRLEFKESQRIGEGRGEKEGMVDRLGDYEEEEY